MGTEADDRYFNSKKVKSFNPNLDGEKKKKKNRKVIENEGGQNEQWKKKKKKKILHQPLKKLREDDPFPGRVPVPHNKVNKYKRGDEMRSSNLEINDRLGFERQQRKYKSAAKQSARAEFLMAEEAGFLELAPDDDVTQITQKDIADSVDVFSAQKHFELDLPQFGPYRMNFTRNGRHLALAGAKGHVAALDWQTKRLSCEMNVMETVSDVRWLHQETMFAVAQKQWTYIYDNQGIELHCLKMLNQVLRMDFLPYHFLLVTASSLGYLNYLDVSIGELVATHYTKLGRLDVMAQNPANAIIHLGHSGGTVTLWSPNQKEPLAKMLCHGGGVRSVAVDPSGNYMATSGVDRHLKIWDLRKFQGVSSYRLSAGAGQLSFSQRGLLAAGMGNIVQVFKDPRRAEISGPYLHQSFKSTVHGLQFCPFEDVLGVSHAKGYASLLVPGAGEANFDALEVNPYQSKRQRQNAEVKMLLDKVQPELISLDTSQLGQVDTDTLQDRVEDMKKLLYLKVPKIDFEPRHKMKGKGKAGHVEKRKRIMQQQKTREFVKDAMKTKAKAKITDRVKPKTVLDRFKKKSKG